MKHAVERHIAGHLRWLEDGTVLASWRLNTLPRPRNERSAGEVAREHTELWRAIAGHRFWLESLLIWTDPSEIANAMLAGVNLAASPAWADTTEAALDVLDQEGLGTRRHILTVQLKLPTKLMITASALAAANDAVEALSMSAIPPSPDLLAAAMTAATKIERALPKAFAPRRVTHAEVVWTRRHAWSRQMADLVDPDRAPELAEELLEGAQGLGRIHLDPNGASTGEYTKATAALRNRWIAVSDDRGATCYQSGLIISRIPRHMGWPDTEFLGRIDDSGVPVDLTITGIVRTASEALRKSENAMKQLGDQAAQVSGDGEGTAPAAHQVRVSDATQIAVDYAAELTRGRTLVEVEPVLLVSVAADTPEACDRMAQDYMNADVNRELGIVRPIGEEASMFWARQPGGIPSPSVNSYRQLSHSAGGIGQSALITSAELGDQTGIPLAINEGSALRSLVMIEPFGLGKDFKRKSPSMATVGDQGGGKTNFAKTFAGHMVDRGARFIATDTSAEGEWGTFTRSLNTSLEIVDFANPTCSIDPLRILSGNDGATVMQSFLSTLLDIDATGLQGRTLAKVLRPSYLTQHNLRSSGALMGHLASLKGNGLTKDGIDATAAREIAERVSVFTDLDDANGLAAVLFDPNLPPLDMDTQCQIWWMNAVQLPTEAEISNVKLFEQMSVEKRLGRAAYALYARFAQLVCTADENTPALQNVDEFHHMHSSPEAMQANAKFLRMGRHHMAFWHAQSQLPRDFMGLGDLIRTRVVLRLSTEEAALEAAAFLGKRSREDATKESQEEADERYQLAREILAHNAPGNGAGMMLDHRGAIGSIQTLLPFTLERRNAASTAHQTANA